ncbi:MAG: nitrous oxide reductase family maturation protein NosD, partial [Aliifodinibius sp.]|nr:nitrous oxide reductase family maturation protein NosD [Fodinibius sp.]NIV10325.1 nitrous oxide reductase family maturation protein NosD [Fodinibius sp.]NIY23965.1 nitrous oxide reductase family maturation protein NosD [Fodinibius sp.]
EGYDLNRDGVGDVPHRPVRLFSILVEKQPQSLLLLRSLLVDLLDAAEKFMPVLTPETLLDSKPQMEPVL